MNYFLGRNFRISTKSEKFWAISKIFILFEDNDCILKNRMQILLADGPLDISS